jgi:nicotine blue oxidoreductase
VIAAVVLAAGAASRFGSPKQRLLLAEVLERVAATHLHEIVVVEGAHTLDISSNSLLQGRVRLVDCPEWERGIGASLRCGLAALGDDVEAAVVVLADGPDLAPASVSRVVDAWRRENGELIAASYDGDRGHPVLVARSAWQDIPDSGLRDREPRLVPCDDLGAPGDVDTPDDLPERFRARD